MTVKTAKFFIAKLTFLDRKDSTSSLDVWVGTRTLPTGSAWTGSPWIYGSILGLDGFGQSMGEVLPRVSTGTITLNTTRGSYEHHKSIVDLLDKYTILKQSVEVYSFSKHPDAVGDVADRELEFVGEVSGINYSPSSRTLAIEVQTREISSDTPLRRITKDKAPNAPDRSIGRYLPLVFGRAQVPAYPVGTLAGNKNSYVLISRWTLPAGTFTSDGVHKYFYQQNGEYVEVTITNSVSFNAYFSGVEYAELDLQNEQGHFDWGRALDGTSNFILTSALFSADLLLGGGDSTTANPTFTLEIYNSSPESESPISNSPVATATISGSEDTYDTASSASLPFPDVVLGSKYRVCMPFDRPYALQNDRVFLVTRVADDRSFAGTGWRFYRSQTWNTALLGTSWFSYLREDNVGKGGRDWIKKFQLVSGNGYLYMQLFCLTGFLYNTATGLVQPGMLDTTFLSLNQNEDFYIRKESGYPPVASTYTYKALAGDPQPLDISNLPLIVEVQGIDDFATGLITGTPYALIERGDHAIRAVWYLMNGNLTDLDTTTFLPGNYIGNVSGATEGKKSYREILADLLTNTSSRLLPRRNGKLALWSYGISQTPSFFLSEADCTLDDWTEDAGESLVNRVEIAFDRLAIPLNVEDLQTQASVNHAQTYTLQDDESIEFFGIRDLADSAVNLDWIRDPVQAERWARFVLETYSAGSIYATFTVPFWKENYREIELYDIVCLNHIDIPSEYGSQSSNIAIKTEVGSTEDYGEGFPFRQSNNVFLRILSRSPRLTTNEAEATITFTGKVLRQREFK